MNEPFRRKQLPGLPAVYVAENWRQLCPGLDIGISSRHDGVSAKPYYSLNCGFHVGDDPASVIENRRLLAAVTSQPFEAWTFADQVHGHHVAIVSEERRGAGRDRLDTALSQTDAMVTDQPGICLSLQFADCVPLFFVDREQRVIALAHAGWRGTVSKIAEHTIEQMVGHYGCRRDRIMALTGPSIHSCCYEVDSPVIRQVDALCDELGIREAVYTQVDGSHCKLDLQQLNRQIMIKAGLLSAHIELSGICTSCSTDSFFSHRAEQGMTGRMVAWIAWENADKDRREY